MLKGLGRQSVVQEKSDYKQWWVTSLALVREAKEVEICFGCGGDEA